MIAGELAKAGKDVVVLEAGGYYNEADFNQLELWAYENLYRARRRRADRQRLARADGRLEPRRRVDGQLDQLPAHDRLGARGMGAEHGLEGLAGKDYDAHLDAVWERAQVNDRCSDFNGPSCG